MEVRFETADVLLQKLKKTETSSVSDEYVENAEMCRGFGIGGEGGDAFDPDVAFISNVRPASLLFNMHVVSFVRNVQYEH